MKIPFNRPVILESGDSDRSKASRHINPILEAISNQSLAGGGAFNKHCEKELEKKTGASVKLTTSATHALEMMAILSELKPGDEVIVPSFTFSSTANAFVLRGAKLLFADNDEFGNLLPSEVERLATPKTKAVAVMHYAGNSCNMNELLSVCRSKNLELFEDAAQSIGVSFQGKALGTFGRFGCFSFHETKNTTSGEGGALLMKEADVDRAEILREKGTNRQKFLQGQVDKYTWVDVGSSYVLSELNAAYLYPQLQSLEEILQKRKRIWTTYLNELSAVFEKNGASILKNPSHNSPNYHLFGVLFQKVEQRNSFISKMKEKGVSTPFHYVALHKSPFGQKFYSGKSPESLPGCERFSNCLVRLPLFYNLSEQELSYVIDSIGSVW